MGTPKRAEVWIADLGIAAKIRPVLVLSVEYGDEDYALLAVVPHTTSPRGASFEVSIPVIGLKPGAFNVQGLMAIPAPKLLRRVSELSPEGMALVEATVREWLGLTA